MKETDLTSALRRRLLKGMALAFGASLPGVGAASAASAGRKLLLIETHVAGTSYYQAAEVSDRLWTGVPLRLVRQPDNLYDALAIEVFTRDGLKLGYVPRVHNPPFARLMDAGHKVEAEVVDADTDCCEIRMSLSLIE